MADAEVIERVLRGETALYGILIPRYRSRLQAMLDPILRNDAEVEDAMQEGHMHALAHLRQFAGRSSFATWITRIMIHEAFAILRRRRRLQPLEAPDGERSRRLWLICDGPDPEQQVLNAELRRTLMRALGMLPGQYRSVFLLREIEEMSTTDAAGKLGISEECVRIRLHRARALLRRRLARRTGAPWSTHRESKNQRAPAEADAEGFSARSASARRRIPSRISRAPVAV